MKLATGVTMVSMQEVATRSRVSIATVSNFLNNPERVSEELRRRVADAIDELGYIRNEPARELRTGVSTALGFLAQELDNPVSSAVAVHLEKRASADGALLFIANTDGDPQLESRFLRRFAQQRVRGLILATGMTLDRDLHLLRRLAIPTILMDAYLPDDRFSSVAVDDRAAAVAATRHLVGKGASHLCFVGFSATSRQVRERHQGMVDALSDVRDVRSSVVHTKDRSIAAGLHAAQQLLALQPGERPDAVLAANDSVALGLLQGLAQGRMHIPRDIAIFGFDDLEYAATAVVPLSTVRRPLATMTETAIDLLNEQIADPSAAVRHVSLTAEIVLRQSA
jgi:LacI family transcriptional regulator